MDTARMALIPTPLWSSTDFRPRARRVVYDSLMGSFVVAQPPPAAKAKALDTSDMRAGQAAALVGFTGPPPPSRPNAGPAGAMRA